MQEPHGGVPLPESRVSLAPCLVRGDALKSPAHLMDRLTLGLSPSFFFSAQELRIVFIFLSGWGEKSEE